MAIYDGPSIKSPLIGQYCGTLRCSKGGPNRFPFFAHIIRQTFSPLVVPSGECPPLDSIFTTSTQFYVVFKSDAAVNGDGFGLSWAAIPSPGASSGLEGLVPDLTQSPSAAFGAGIAVVSGSVKIFPTPGGSVLFARNSVLHPVNAQGGGLSGMLWLCLLAAPFASC